MWIILGVAVLLFLASLVDNIRNRIKLKKTEKQVNSLKEEASKFAQELLKQKEEFDTVVVPIEGPTEIEWRKEDVQVISKNAFVEDNIIYPSRAITKNQLIVVYKPSSVGGGGGIKIFAYVGKTNVKAPNDDKITPISDIMQIGEEGG